MTSADAQRIIRKGLNSNSILVKGVTVVTLQRLGQTVIFLQIVLIQKFSSGRQTRLENHSRRFYTKISTICPSYTCGFLTGRIFSESPVGSLARENEIQKLYFSWKIPIREENLKHHVDVLSDRVGHQQHFFSQ